MKGRWTIILLVASLALNLFLIGAAAGVIALGARIAEASPVARPGPVLRRAAMALTPENRRSFVAVLRESGQAARPTTQQARQLRREAGASVGDTTFDAAAAKAKLGEARTLDQASRARIEDAVIDFAASLPTDERKRFGAAMARAIPTGAAAAPAKK